MGAAMTISPSLDAKIIMARSMRMAEILGFYDLATGEIDESRRNPGVLPISPK
jgi:hypothetical protein